MEPGVHPDEEVSAAGEVCEVCVCVCVCRIRMVFSVPGLPAACS